MKASTTKTGSSVVSMRAFDPDIVGSIFTRVDMAWSKGATAQFVVRDLGDLSLIRSMHRASGSRSRRLERHMTGDEGHYFACMPLHGSLEVQHLNRECGQGQTGVIKHQQMALVNTNEEYEIAMSDELDAIWLRIPTGLLRAHAISVDDLLGCPIDVQTGLGLMAKQMLQAALEEETALSDRCARVFSQSLVSFLGEVVTAKLTSDSASSTRGRRMILMRAQEFINEHIYDDDLDPATIAKGVGISTRYLSDIFAAEGLSPMRFVLQRRLELCRMELERQGSGQQLICEIAYSMGFTNVSSFNRAFKAHFGQSPREFIAKKSGTPKRLN